MTALAAESRARNRGSIIDEDELIAQETERLRERVQKRIEDLELIEKELN